MAKLKVLLRYRIRLISAGTYVFYRVNYVVDPRKERNGSWYDEYQPIAKHWKTRGGAQRWLDARPDVKGIIEIAP
jgi:hypothetical protein